MAECVYKTVGLNIAKPLAILKARGGVLQKKFRPARAAAGRQVRGGRGRPPLPEFKDILVVKGSFAPGGARCQPGHSWQASKIDNIEIPKGAKTVRAFFSGATGATEVDQIFARALLPCRLHL